MDLDFGSVITEKLSSSCKVILHDGEYNVKTPIVFGSNNSCLIGYGPSIARIIATIPIVSSPTDGVVQVQSRSKVQLANVSVDLTSCPSADFCKNAVNVQESSDIAIYNVALYGGTTDSCTFLKMGTPGLLTSS